MLSSTVKQSPFALVAALLLFGGCSSPPNDDADDVSDGPSPDTFAAGDATDGGSTTGEDSGGTSHDAANRTDTSGQPENRLENPSFEQGPTRDGCPPEWTCKSYSSDSGTFSVVDESHHRDQAAQWTRTGGKTTGTVIKQRLTSDEGDRYRVDVSVKGRELDDSAQVFVQVLFDTADQKSLRTEQFTAQGSLDEWTRISGTTPAAPPGTQAVRFNLSIDATEGTVLWDHASMVFDSGEDSEDSDPSVPTWKTIGGGEPYVQKRRRTGAETFCSPPADASVVANRNEFQRALDDASAGDVVYIDPSARIEVGRSGTLDIPDGVTLASNRGCSGAEGGMLVDEEDDVWKVLTAGEGARVIGIRMAGPHREFFEYRKPISIGIATNGQDVEFANNEIYGFSHASIRLDVVEGVHIHHNDIHHNPMDGLGYGVSVGGEKGSQTTIEYNYFNYNRHSIMSNGTAGYTARYNVFGPEGISYAAGTHRPGSTRIEIHHNTVKFEKHIKRIENNERDPVGPNITIRGVPSDVADIHHNWLFNPRPPANQPHGWSEEAIIQPVDDDGNQLSSWNSVQFQDNHYGSDAPGSCDIGAPRRGCEGK